MSRKMEKGERHGQRWRERYIEGGRKRERNVCIVVSIPLCSLVPSILTSWNAIFCRTRREEAERGREREKLFYSRINCLSWVKLQLSSFSKLRTIHTSLAVLSPRCAPLKHSRLRPQFIAWTFFPLLNPLDSCPSPSSDCQLRFIIDSKPGIVSLKSCIIRG